MPLRLYNTLTKREEEFVPLKKGEATMYTCGPTVYGRPHIGNYSSFLMADLLRRWLEVNGCRVTHVKNITDVGHLLHDVDHGDDKVEREAKKEQVHPLDIARRYTEQYLEDEAALGMLEPAHRPRASETIPEMIAIIQELLQRGHAYETKDGIYFSVGTFPQYGKLSGNTLENLSAGARVVVREKKKHPADFALWKKTVGEHAHHILRWHFPSGRVSKTEGEDPLSGFPGWHIECSAMSKKFLGQPFDLHTGGEDNIFPHHECEIAQSECSGEKPFVRLWLHKRRIEIATAELTLRQAQGDSPKGSQKMSKSLGNVLTLPDIVTKGYHPLDLRYYLLSVHYRTNLKFSWKGMDDARKARRRIVAWMEEVRGDRSHASDGQRVDVDRWKRTFASAMNADLNTPATLASIFEAMNAYHAKRPLDAISLQSVRAFIEQIRHTFGCFEREEESLPAPVQTLIDQRSAARAKKDFKESDRLREELRALGYEVRDVPDGQKLSKL